MAKRIDNYDTDPNNPKTLSFDEIKAAADRIKPFINPTPLHTSHQGKKFSMNLMYKMECVLPSGSFKERGALNALLQLPKDKQKIGLVIASLGNHAYSLCHHTTRMKIPVTAICPTYVPLRKLERIHTLGVKVIVKGDTIEEAVKAAQSLAKEKGYVFISGRDHPHILAGNGTIALEILQQVPNVDAIIMPVGTGGLIAGVGVAIKRLKPNCLIYGVQSELMPSFIKALEVGEPTVIPEVNTIADCIQMTKAGTNAFHNAKQNVDKMMIVKEDWISRAILHLTENERYIVEGAGAVPLAAIMENLVPELKTKNVVCIVTGGNIDATLLGRVYDRGLAAEGRLIKFRVGIKDSSEALGQLMAMISGLGFNVVRFFRDCVWTKQDVFHVEVRIMLEALNLEHALELKKALDKAYPGLTLFDTEPFNDNRMCPCYIAK